MNFYSHAAIASLYTDDAGVALGAMLPDFASLVGSRPPETTDVQILRGSGTTTRPIGYFTDPIHFDGRAAESGRLRSLGLARGTAAAAAHVGIELVLDDSLSEDNRTQELFRAALNAAAPFALAKSLRWSSPEQAIRFEELRQRLLALVLLRPSALLLYSPNGFAVPCRVVRNWRYGPTTGSGFVSGQQT